MLTSWISRTHERLAVDEVATGASDGSFGLTVAIVFALIGLSPLVRGRPVRGWAFVVAAVVILAALIFPRGLAPLNRIWLRLGLFLHACTTGDPGLGLLHHGDSYRPRALGKDSIQRQADEDWVTYWIERQSPGPEPDTMGRQF